MDSLAVRPKPLVLKSYASEGQLKFKLWFLLALLLLEFLTVNPQFLFFLHISMYISLKMQEVA